MEWNSWLVSNGAILNFENEKDDEKDEKLESQKTAAFAIPKSVEDTFIYNWYC